MSCVQCVICTDLMHAACILSHLECGHVYHQQCLNRWMRSAKTCPECRGEIKTAPRRLYLDFTKQPELAELRGEISQRSDLLETTVAKLEQQNVKKDRIIRLTLTQINRLAISNVRFKRVVNDLEQNRKISTTKTVQLTQQLREEIEHRQVLSKMVESMSKHESSLNANLRENKTRMDQMTETIRSLSKSQADCIIENYQLELAKSELTTRLDQFRTEFVQANNGLQQMKSENENLRNELKVQKVGQQQLIELNMSLNEKLQKTEEALLAMTNANMMMKASNDGNEAKPINLRDDLPPNIIIPSHGNGDAWPKLKLSQKSVSNDETEGNLWNLRNDHSSLTIPSHGNEETWVKQTQQMGPKRRIGEIFPIPNNFKRPKLLESQSNPINKIVMVKSTVGWTIVPRSG